MYVGDLTTLLVSAGGVTIISLVSMLETVFSLVVKAWVAFDAAVSYFGLRSDIVAEAIHTAGNAAINGEGRASAFFNTTTSYL
jgi:hypothetical protein